MLVGANSLQVLTIKSLSTIMRIAAGSSYIFSSGAHYAARYLLPSTTHHCHAARCPLSPLPSANCPQLPIIHCPLPTTHCPHCLLPTAHTARYSKSDKKNLQLAHLRFFKTKLFICATKQLFKIINLKFFSFEYFCN